MSKQGITLSRAVDEYFRADRMRSAAAGTRAQHRRTLAALTRVCGPDRTVSRITAANVADTIDLLREPAGDFEIATLRLRGRAIRRGRSESSLNIDRSVLRRFVSFLQERGYLSPAQNPSSDLASAPRRRPQGQKRSPMSREAVLELLKMAGEYHPRERITVALAVLAGLRESEILGLRWRDVLWTSADGPVLDFFRPKGRDAHRVFISPVLERELRAWHAIYAAQHPAMYPSWYVVPARVHGWVKDGKLGGEMVPEWPIVPDRPIARRSRYIIKEMMEEIGITDLEGKGMHTLRRTFANILLEDTEDIRVVQNALGHKSQLTTEVYLDKDRDFAAAAAFMRTWDPYAKTHGQADGNVIPMRKRSAG